MCRATFAAGCFWGVEETFRGVEGVEDVSVGYTGGHAEHPTYELVCSSATGHAEAVEVLYDAERASYDELLELFWRSHDPTQVDRQGPDIGPQYRSAIFYHDEEQRAAAEASKRRLEESGELAGPVATQIAPAAYFWPAEEHHQRYFEKRRRRGLRGLLGRRGRSR